MSDERLRELERRFRATGSADDESRFLAASVRAGAIELERVRIAAFVGHGPAIAALGDRAPEVPAPENMPGYRTRFEAITVEDIGPLELAGLCGQELCMRLAIAAVRHALGAHETKRGADGRARAQAEAARACLRAAEDWVLDSRFGRRPT